MVPYCCCRCRWCCCWCFSGFHWQVASSNSIHWMGQCFPHEPHTKYIYSTRDDRIQTPHETNDHIENRHKHTISILYTLRRCDRELNEPAYSHVTNSRIVCISAWMKWREQRTKSQKCWTVVNEDAAGDQIDKIDDTSIVHEPDKDTSSTHATSSTNEIKQRNRGRNDCRQLQSGVFQQYYEYSEHRQRLCAVLSFFAVVVVDAIGAVIVKSCFTNRKLETMCSVLVFNFVH